MLVNTKSANVAKTGIFRLLLEGGKVNREELRIEVHGCETQKKCRKHKIIHKDKRPLLTKAVTS